MSSCKDCIHCDVCKDYQDNICSACNKRHEEYRVDESGLCRFFKDKSKVIELPCKVGETVYHIKEDIKRNGRKKVRETTIEPLIVDSFVIGDFGSPQANCCDNDRNEWTYYDIFDFGRYVFLTLEEAQKKLEEMGDE